MWTEVLNATYLDSYRILVQFNNGVRKIVDFANIVKRYPVFQPLSNLTCARISVRERHSRLNSGRYFYTISFIATLVVL